MAKFKGAVVVDIERCKGCGVCIASCPVNAIAHSGEVNAKGYDYMKMSNPDNCIGCAVCATVCPDSVITVYKVNV